MKTSILIKGAVVTLIALMSWNAMSYVLNPSSILGATQAPAKTSEKIDVNSETVQSVIEQLNLLQDSIEMMDVALKELTTSEPREPQHADGGRGVIFDLDFKARDFPELAGYEGVSFALDIQRSSITRKDFDTEWSSCKVKRSKGLDDYKLILATEEKSASFYCFPVFKGKAYGKAMKLFEQKLAVYRQKFDLLMKRKNNFKMNYSRLRAKWHKSLSEIENQVEEEGRNL